LAQQPTQLAACEVNSETFAETKSAFTDPMATVLHTLDLVQRDLIAPRNAQTDDGTASDVPLNNRRAGQGLLIVALSDGLRPRI
jgi:hypothetical protein